MWHWETCLGSITLQQYLTLSKSLHFFKCQLALQNRCHDALRYLEIIIMEPKPLEVLYTKEYFQFTNEEQKYIKALNFSCLRHSIYILSDSIMKLCGAGLSTFITEVKRLKMRKVVSCQMPHNGTPSFQLLRSTWETSLVALFLILPYQVLLKITVNSTFKIHPESDHVPSIILKSHHLLPRFPCGLPNHIYYLLQNQSFETSVNTSPQVKTPSCFPSRSEQKLKPSNGLRCLVCLYSFLPLRPWVKLHSPLCSLCSILPALPLCLSLVRKGVCHCLGAFALVSPLVWNAFPHIFLTWITFVLHSGILKCQFIRVPFSDCST